MKQALAYNWEMDQLMVANTFNNEVEKENILGPDEKEESKGPKITHPRDMMIDSYKEEEKSTTPWLEMGSNDVNITPREIGFAHSVQHKGPRDS
jgi:hypothetical protein